jgi:hypothetical protein
MTLDEFFKDRPDARALHRAVEGVVRTLGGCETRVSRSQIGFHRAHPFAATWTPARYLKGEAAPLVLSVYLRRRDGSDRWKEIVEPAPGRFTHHMELHAPEDIDDFVREILAEAWREAA